MKNTIPIAGVAVLFLALVVVSILLASSGVSYF